jgi:endonuclease/exonuclease/phosphatase (EEP) superfamily protein YafD
MMRLRTTPRIVRFGRFAERFAAVLAIMIALAVIAPGTGWIADLIAGLAAQLGLVAVLGLGAFLARRRWLPASIILASLLVIGAVLARGRAPRGDGEATVRVLICNTHAENDRLDDLTEWLRRCPDDIVVLTEVNPELIRSLERGSPLEAAYPYSLRRGPREGLTSWRVVLSRWPLEDRRTADEVRCVVESPAGRFGLVAVHPASPRTPRRWAGGNALVSQAGQSADTMRAEGLPVIVLGDLNGTPGGHRSRLLRREHGLLRAKPWLRGRGTYPASLAWPFALALDDAFLSDRWRVTSWRTQPAVGSDHRAVEIGLVLTD